MFLQLVLPKDHLQMPGILQRSLLDGLASTEGDASVCGKGLQGRVDLAKRGQLQGVPLLWLLEPCAGRAAVNCRVLQIDSQLTPLLVYNLLGKFTATLRQ